MMQLQPSKRRLPYSILISSPPEMNLLTSIPNVSYSSLPPKVSAPPGGNRQSSSPLSGGGGGEKCHLVWYEIVLVAAAVLFLLYLAINAKRNVRKLWSGRSFIMISYYALLWLASVLNLAWCSLQAWQCTPGKEIAWNLLSLFTASSMVFMEISILAFLLQDNYSSRLEALARTFVVSGVVVVVDILFKAVYVFGFGVPLFIDGVDGTQRMKWGFWIIHKLLLAGVYGYILFVHFTKWRENLPLRPAFYNYVTVMFILNAVALFACGFAGIGVSIGIWLYIFTVICYHCFYLPIVYVAFLADLFQEEDFLLENAYYSEMKDAGFFDVEWD
ncbi:hypothetical protein K2173_007046 [Erythroxylum novogranatense]|uniref:Transmembrane protein adipocyte-associated 1 n=1 Tax=Erythroxylum novogranatense TaxID=1862640 RepID=A0AAV8SKC8_9ROSI|nr:hypothetical protein K2173_007046 [Erythroxylum novogranatense]